MDQQLVWWIILEFGIEAESAVYLCGEQGIVGVLEID